MVNGIGCRLFEPVHHICIQRHTAVAEKCIDSDIKVTCGGLFGNNGCGQNFLAPFVASAEHHKLSFSIGYRIVRMSPEPTRKTWYAIFWSPAKVICTGGTPFGYRGLFTSSGVVTRLHPRWLDQAWGFFIS